MHTGIRRLTLCMSGLAVIAMGSVTVACSPRTEKPAETSVPPSSSSATPSPTEKNMQTNVTRGPMSVSPGGGGNPAVPCGFGPQGGLPCTNH